MTSFDCIKEIMYGIDDDTIVIASTGFISREVYAIRDRPLNFYMQGSMGAALALGMGMALNSDLKIEVIVGDGATLMSMGTLILFERLDVPYLILHIIDNKCHASTGGQPTCEFNFLRVIPWAHLHRCNYAKTTAPRIPLTCKQIKERFENAVHDLLCKSKH